MSHPTISIVTVCLNDLSALKSTVISVQDQIENIDLEHVIIDGGSTDGTVEYLQRLKLDNVVWVSKQDNGIFDAFNIGVLKSSGSWIHILNAGDTYRSGLNWKFLLKTKADFLCFGVLKRKKQDYVWWPTVDPANGMVDVAHPGLIVHKRVYQTGAIYDTSLQYVADSKFIWDLVTKDNSIMFKFILVDMVDGGYSTNFRFKHELEKQFLIFNSNLPRKNRAYLHFKYFVFSIFRLIKIVR